MLAVRVLTSDKRANQLSPGGHPFPIRMVMNFGFDVSYIYIYMYVYLFSNGCQSIFLPPLVKELII